tara:strand:- start:274 stop:510 length:237 start_codon:yes stop_codon:yes gene_type:complete
LITFIIKKFWKTIIFVIGFIITLLGIIMLFTPGQGIATIIIGLGILATEFVWAKKINFKLKTYLKSKGRNFKTYFKKK